MWISTKAPSSMGDCLRNILQGLLDHGQERLELVCRPLYSSVLGWRSVCLILDALFGETSPGPLLYGAESHGSHKVTFVHEWMPNCYCLVWDISDECLVWPYG